MTIKNFIFNAFLGTLLCMAIIAAATGTMLIIDAIYRLCVN